MCAGCHPRIAQSYAQTGMGRSFYRLGPQTAVEDFGKRNPFYHQASETWYSMLQRDGSYYQRRWRIGPGGAETEIQESRIDYVMGSGNHARTYLHRTERGGLTELPLGWYPENGGSWAMSPGHDREYALPPRSVAYECMFCHNAYPKIPAGHEEVGSEPLFEGSLPEGIDCQRCHGPGANHVRAAQTAGSAVEAVRRAIVNPAKLTVERGMEVCLQCHLETTSLPLPHSILRYGRGPFSYRPGEPLGGFATYFDHAAGSKYQDDFEIVSSAYRLRRSQCFLRSGGKLSCTTCHNPHENPRGEQAAAHFNTVCGTCHGSALQTAIAASKHTSAADCVGCHMPKRRTRDVIHAVMTDHWIQRRVPAGDLVATIAERQEFDRNQYRGEVVPYYPSPLPQTGENALYAAVAQVTQKSNLEKGLPRLAAEIARQKPSRAEFYVELGQAWMAARKIASAVGTFEEAMRRAPNSPVVRLNLADALTEAGQHGRAVEVLNRALKIAPRDALLWYQLGVTQSSAGKNAEAIAAFEKSVALDADMADAHNLLGAALAASGDLDRAEKELRRALEVNPDLPEGLGNLGHLLAARGALEHAAYYFARSVRVKPGDTDVRVNYSVVLAGMHRWEEAQQQIDAAVQADPKSPEAHNFRGTLLERQGSRDEALGEFLEAVQLRPEFGLAHLNAARVLAGKGDSAAAQAHLRQAANSPDENIRRKALAALQSLGAR